LAIGAPNGEALVGTSLAEFADPADRARFAGWLTELAGREERVKRGRARFVRANGVPIEIAIVATPTIFDGEPAVQVAVHDVTAQGALEEQLRQAQKMEAVGQLAAGVAHDFNNILTAISGYTQLILDENALDDDLRKDVEEIQRAGTRAAGLTKQLLAVSRRQLVRAEVVDLNEVIAAAEQLLRRTIGAQVTLDVLPEGSACSVLADRGQLEQILMNLVLNARDAMPNGGVLRVETKTIVVGEQSDHPVAVSPGRYVALSVRDSGAGMTPETMRKIFEPFFTTKAVGDGTGLGLATVYGIVTGANGYVWAESAVGAGTAFTVLLPLVERPATIATKDTSPSLERGDAGCILLVEDEAPVRAAARRILEREGHRVHEAKNASDALMLWEESGSIFDCVVTDVVMPGLRGPELIERLRFDRPDVPVLFVSGYTDRALGRLDLEVPNTSFLEKPFEPKQLAAAVAKLLHERAAVPA
jgi:two-component system cell cycle sensor histidine kinase/response regulator CckA